MEGNTLTTKRCTLCGEHKSTTEFHKGNRKDGLQPYCKPCNIARAKQWQMDNPTRDIFNNKRSRCKRDGKEFTLDYDSIQWPTHCPVLGIELEYTRRRGKSSSPEKNSPSFDRIDPTKGYVPGNVIIVSNLANTIKSNATVDQLERVASFYRQLIPHGGSSNDQEAS